MVFLRVLSCVSCSMFLVQLLWFCDIELVNVVFGTCFRVLLIYWSGGYDIEIVMGPAFGIQSLYSTYREIELAMVFLCALFCVPSSLTGEGEGVHWPWFSVYGTLCFYLTRREAST